MDAVPRAQRLLDAARDVTHAAAGTTVVSRLVRAACDDLPSASAGVVWGIGADAVVATSVGAGGAFERRQIELGEGPTISCARIGRPLLRPAIFTAEQIDEWPALAAVQPDLGIRAAFAFPLRVGASQVGVLAFYPHLVGRLDSGRLAVAMAYADAAAIALLEPDTDLFRAARVTHRAEVHQATGFIAERTGVSLDDALALIRAYAFAHDREIIAVSRDVLARTVRLED